MALSTVKPPMYVPESDDWKEFVERLECYLDANGIGDSEDADKKKRVNIASRFSFISSYFSIPAEFFILIRLLLESYMIRRKFKDK